MGIIGIAANPASGKDIRRLVSQATVFDNNEKTNIIQRILLTVAKFGPHEVYLMPDRYNFAARLLKKSEQNSEKFPPGLFRVLDMPTRENAGDTEFFAHRMKQMGAGALIVLGGDGTCRAAAKCSGDLPILPVSTGTNNAFPSMCEGTAVGMAAAALAGGYAAAGDCTQKEKRLEIWRRDTLLDTALVDAVFTRQLYVGTKAVWDVEDISHAFVTSCHPAKIGFSSLVGCKAVVRPGDDFGAYTKVGEGTKHLVPLSAGVVEQVALGNTIHMPLDMPFAVYAGHKGMIALDGEKEVPFQKGETLQVIVKRNGPRTVDIQAALESAVQKGFFQLSTEEGNQQIIEPNHVCQI